MVDFLCEFHQFPGSSKDRFVSLLLPKFNIERAIWKPTLDQPCLPLRILRTTHARLAESAFNIIRISG